MSKKRKRTPEAPPPTGAELVEMRVIREEDWALEAFRARLTFPEMRRLAIVAPEDGGLGYAVSEHALRNLVQQARKRHGDTAVTRDERVERQQLEIDARIRAARHDLNRAHAALNEPKPERAEFGDPEEYAAALGIHWKKVEAAAKMVDAADRRLATAMRDERDLHGLNAATKIEAEVTTRDAVTEELNAMLLRAGREPITSDAEA